MLYNFFRLTEGDQLVCFVDNSSEFMILVSGDLQLRPVKVGCIIFPCWDSPLVAQMLQVKLSAATAVICFSVACFHLEKYTLYCTFTTGNCEYHC